MVCNIRTSFVTIAIIELAVTYLEANIHIDSGEIIASLRDHIIITDKDMFPYVVAILKMASYLSAGAMISDSWVLTAGDSLYLVRESIRQIRVRIGSVNYKRGGLVLPIKYFHIHPYFDDTTPIYDLALLKLSERATRTIYARAIWLNREIKDLSAIHFIVTSWMQHSKEQVSNNKSMHDIITSFQSNRLLMVRQMHPTNTKECRIQLQKLDISDTGTLLCLNTNRRTDRCDRPVGAPVVKNGVLWGIVSSWRHENCELHPGPTFVNLVSSPNISLWIQAVMRDLHWQLEKL